ncbi:hypothetical protein ACO2Q0_12725 [Phenylobacterium sp. VNQ135]|uniref:hypothetical protein n=1 Tax=Phenylobacterium sp. VNQ135 TaxID=3400922 RepID=UPI003C068E0A
MTATMDNPAAKAPRHLWVVGIVALLWNGFGAFDYTMTNLQGDAWLRQAGMTDAQITYFHAMPVWMTAVWAVGVWGGLLGAILLLVRRKLATPVFLASLAAYVLSLVYYYLLSDGLAAMGQAMIPMNIMILVGCLFFAWYAWTMTKRGVLR